MLGQGLQRLLGIFLDIQLVGRRQVVVQAGVLGEQVLLRRQAGAVQGAGFAGVAVTHLHQVEYRQQARIAHVGRVGGDQQLVVDFLHQLGEVVGIFSGEQRGVLAGQPRFVAHQPVDAAHQALGRGGVLPLWISLEVVAQRGLGLGEELLVDLAQVRVAHLVEGILLRLVEQRTGDHVARGFLQPGLIALQQSTEGFQRLAEAPAVEVRRALQVAAVGLGLGALQVAGQQHAELGLVPLAGTQQGQARTGEPLAVGAGEAVGQQQLAEEIAGGVDVVAAAAAAFAAGEAVGRGGQAVRRQADARGQVGQLGGAGIAGGGLAGRCALAPARQRERHLAVAQLLFVVRQGAVGDTRLASIGQQQLQVDPAVVARTQERQVVAHVQRVALEVPAGVAGVVAARARFLHGEAAGDQGQQGESVQTHEESLSVGARTAGTANQLRGGILQRRNGTCPLHREQDCKRDPAHSRPCDTLSSRTLVCCGAKNLPTQRVFLWPRQFVDHGDTPHA